MIGNIFDIPVKTTINTSLQGKTILVCGASKTGKSTIGSHAPRPVFLSTENGTEALTGMVNIPIGSWSDFKNVVGQLTGPKGRENFDTVVVDTATNLMLLLDKYVGQKLSTDKTAMDFGSDAQYGKGTKKMRDELGLQLQKLANQGYILIFIVHTETKTDFNTGKDYIGTSLTNSLFGVLEKAADQIIYLKRDEDRKGNISYTTWFSPKGGFVNTGGRFTPDVEYVETDWNTINNTLTGKLAELGTQEGVTAVESNKPSFTIHNDNEEYDYPALMEEFQDITSKLVEEDPDNVSKISKSVASILGPSRKATSLTKNQVELLYEVVANLKKDFNLE